MKKILLILTLILTLSATISAQSYTREGNTFISSTGERTKTTQATTKTKFTWKDSKGKEYAIHISNKGAAFVFKVSAKTGKEYKNYLGAEISQQICKELKIEYKSKSKKQ